MEKHLLKKSGILAIAITFILLTFWFGVSKLSLGAYNEKHLTRQFLAEDSKIFKTVVIEVGSDTVATIVVGTSSMVTVGTSSYQYQPRIQYDGATGLWSFKNSAGTVTTAFGTITPAYLSVFGNDYVLKSDGSSTRQLLTDSTFAGVGTISGTLNVTGTLSASGANISPAELSYSDGLSGNINDFQSTHQHGGTNSAKVNYIDISGNKPSITADGKTGTTTVNLISGADMSISSVKTAGGGIDITFAPVGSASAKPSIQEGGATTTTSAAFLNFNALDFDTVNDTPGAIIALSLQNHGTTSSAPGYAVLQDASGLIPSALIPTTIRQRVVGYAYSSITTFIATVTSGAYIANDNTLPQSNEGIEILTLDYTPVYATSTIKVNSIGNIGTNDTGSYAILALFLGTETTARATAMTLTTDANIQEIAPIPAGFCIVNENHGTSTLTVKMRGGSSVSGSNNFYVNGGAGSPTSKFGGSLITYLEILEIGTVTVSGGSGGGGGNASYPINLTSDTETTGITPITKGGTGSNTAAGARASIGLGTLATQNGTFSGTSSGTNTGDQTISLTGDVTGTGIGSFAATITAGAVALGTDTAGILPQTQGGWGTDTTGTVAVVAGKIGIGTATPSTKLHVIGTVTVDNDLRVDSNTFVVDAANNSVGIGTITPNTSLHVIGTITASTGFSGDGSALTGVVATPALNSVDATHLKSVITATDTSFDVGSLTVNTGNFRLDSAGSATAVTMTITGTATAANFTVNNLTVTQKAILPGQASTTGSASVTVGAGQNYIINSVGSSTNTIVFNCSGVISATNTGSMNLSGLQGGITLGTTTYFNRYNKPKHFAVSTAVATASASLAGTTTETAMATVLVPAGFMAPTGSFLIYTNWSVSSGTASSKTINLRFGTGTGTTGAVIMGHALLGATTQSAISLVSFGNFGTTTKQIGQRRIDLTTATALPYQTSVDTALDTYIVITATLGTTTDSIDLNNYWMDYGE